MAEGDGRPALTLRPPLAHLVAQHAEEAAHLRQVRTFLVRAGHVGLPALGRLDERIAAHLDGLAVAGTEAASEALDPDAIKTRGGVFVACICALRARDAPSFAALLAMSGTSPDLQAGFVSALAWVPTRMLALADEVLVGEATSWPRYLALQVRAALKGNSEWKVGTLLGDPAADLRARVLRAIGRRACIELLSVCIENLDDEDPGVAFEAARAALLLGDRQQALARLELRAMQADDPRATEALCLVVAVLDVERGRSLLSAVARATGPSRLLLQGVAASGDVRYVPWLIEQMNSPALTRRAGEAFVFVTGADLVTLQLDRPRPSPETTDDGGDDRTTPVALDPDEGLAWPDPAKVATWWREHASQFAAETRYFLGAAPSAEWCLEVLRSGWQPQRAAAAERLVLQSPGAPLFQVAAPAWRQRHALGMV